MVEVMVRIDHVTDLLGRDQLPGLRQHRLRACVVQRTFDQDQVVLHFDQDAVVRASREEPDAVRDLLHRHPLRRGQDFRRNLDARRQVDLDFAHFHVEHGKAAHVLSDAGRKTDPAEVAIARINRDSGRVAQHRVGLDRLDPLHHPVSRDPRGRPEPARLLERHQRQRSVPVQDWVVSQGSLDHAVGRGPKIMDPSIHRQSGGHGRRPGQIPGFVATQQPGRSLLASPHQGQRSPAGRLGAGAHRIFAQRRVLVIDQPRETGEVLPGPGHSRTVRLTKGIGASASGIAQGREIGAAHGLVGVAQHGVRIFSPVRAGCKQQHRGRKQSPAQSSMQLHESLLGGCGPAGPCGMVALARAAVIQVLAKRARRANLA